MAETEERASFTTQRADDLLDLGSKWETGQFLEVGQLDPDVLEPNTMAGSLKNPGTSKISL